MKMPAWSISSLSAFETCPKRVYHIKVTKEVKDPPGESAAWGSWVHKQFENRLREGTPLPVTLSGYERLTKPIAESKGDKLVEYQIALNQDLQPCEWYGKETWVRVVIDAGVVKGESAALWDWKTGKRKPESDQLKLSAAVLMAAKPEVKRVSTAFVWLKDGATDKENFTCQDIPAIWSSFSPRLERMERAYAKTHFPAKPSGLCRKHCPVPNHLCEYSGR